MGDRQIWYHIREGFRSIFTHGLMSIAAVCMTVACLLIMGSFSLIAINANHIEKGKTRGDLGIPYDEDVLRLIGDVRGVPGPGPGAGKSD